MNNLDIYISTHLILTVYDNQLFHYASRLPCCLWHSQRKLKNWDHKYQRVTMKLSLTPYVERNSEYSSVSHQTFSSTHITAVQCHFEILTEYSSVCKGHLSLNFNSWTKTTKMYHQHHQQGETSAMLIASTGAEMLSHEIYLIFKSYTEYYTTTSFGSVLLVNNSLKSWAMWKIFTRYKTQWTVSHRVVTQVLHSMTSDQCEWLEMLRQQTVCSVTSLHLHTYQPCNGWQQWTKHKYTTLQNTIQHVQKKEPKY